MRRLPGVVVFVVLMVFWLRDLPVAAAVYSGTIRSVSAERGSLVVAFAATKKTKFFRIEKTVRVTLDGKDASLRDLKAGQRVSVYTSALDGVKKVVARLENKTRIRKGRVTTLRRSSSGRLEATASSDSSGWKQFRGPNRANVSREKDLLQSWPEAGPKLLWTATGLGEGYSTVSLAQGLVLTMGNQRLGQTITALDLKTGRPVWSARNGATYKQGAGNGPRGTPTIDGDRVYALGGLGDLTCVDLKTGNVRWEKNILREYGGSVPGWGICESVLVDGDRLICTPGGRQATMVALNKQSGRVIWQARAPGSPRAGYASPIVADVGGVRQYINFTSRGVIGVRASDGVVLWENRDSANGTANCSTPVFSDGLVFSASGYGTGGVLLELRSTSGNTSARKVYHTSNMKNHHGGMFVLNGYLYGSNDPGILTCLELKTGRVIWKDRSVGKGSVTYADGNIYLRSESGPVALVEATPTGYREKGRFRQPRRSSRPSWSHPVVADGKLFLRDMDVLLCYDVKGR